MERTEKHSAGRGGFTLIETLISILILVVFAAAIYVVFMTSQRLLYAGMSQAQAIADARPSLERIERLVRGCTNPQVGGGGNSLTFQEDLNHDPYNQNLVTRSLTYGPGADGNFATSDDNTLTYVPNTSQPNTRTVLTMHVAQVVTGAGATLPVFAISGATVNVNYRVRYRYGQMTSLPADISISVIPRN